jgi:hypothetical protein
VKHKNVHCIELKVNDLSQLFNSMDPSPFNEKDLDHDAEEFIESWALEYPAKDPIRLRVHLEHEPAEDPEPVVREAVYHYFKYRAGILRMEFRRLLRQGRARLIVGSAFLMTCVLVGNAIPEGDTRTWSGFFKESLTILGWVSMWGPMQIYLYDLWPVRERALVYEKLSRMPVEVKTGHAKKVV